MLTSVSIVVVLAVIIATIARAVLADERHSAMVGDGADTGRHGDTDDFDDLETRSDPGAGVGGRFPPPEWATSAGGALEIRTDQPRLGRRRLGPAPVEEGVPWWRRLRSGVLLAVLVAALGVVTAAIIGVIVVVGVSVIDQALG